MGIGKNTKVVGVCNTKGGTGKTITSLNIALMLKDRGYNVGLIDADFDSSNFSHFTKVKDMIEVGEDNRFKFVNWRGMQVFSMSLLTGSERSVSMSGNRYIQMLDDVINYGDWENMDYIVLDLPAGSSDVFRGTLSIFAKNIVGNIIVLHPTARDDTERVIRLHRFYEVPILGAIENMSYFECEHGTKYYIFGKGNLDEVCEKYGIRNLGRIPLSIELNQNMEKGEPKLPDDILDPIKNAVEAIEEARITETSLLEKVKMKISDTVKVELQKMIAMFINSINKRVNIGEMRQKHGFMDKKPFDLIITDPTGTKVLVRAHLKVDNYLKVLKNATPDYEIVTDIRTLARVIMQKKRNKDGEIVDYDYMDAWLNGDITLYGIGHMPKAVKAIRQLFTEEQVLNDIRKKYGKFLMRFI